MLPEGYLPYVVRSIKDLEALTTQNDTHCAILSHKLGGKKRRQIEAKALEMKIYVANAGKKMLKEQK
jgi:large subunit ribosomal protein L32e